MITEQAIRNTAKLYECRDASKTLLGDKYDETIGYYKNMLVSDARMRGHDRLSSLIHLCKLSENPFGQIHLIAAYVELMEEGQ